jgi:hypothetical protein
MRDVVLYTTHHDAQVRGLIDTLVAAMRHAGYSSRLASVANSIASPERATAQSTKAAR